jgi:hypothetical protein
VTITPREAEAALLLYRRGLRAGDRALVRHANAALLAYLGQWTGEDQRAEAARLCGTVAGEDDNRASDVM